jgi:hypothetical protein
MATRHDRPRGQHQEAARLMSMPLALTNDRAICCMPLHGNGPDMQHVLRRVSMLVTIQVASANCHVSPIMMSMPAF